MKKFKCYLCNKPNVSIIRNRLRNNIKRNVLECPDCSLVYLEPKKTDLVGFYAREYRNLYTPIVGQISTSREVFDMYLPHQAARVERLRPILKKNMKVLDIGCSSGHFLYAVKKYVKETVGLEYNLKDAEFIRKELGFRVYTKPIEQTNLPEKYFDLITIYQAFEHLDDPLSFLANVSKYLKDGGYLCIEVPNYNDALITLYKLKPFADFWFREVHLFNYTAKALTLMMAKAGFKGKVVPIQTVNFDNHLYWLFANKPQRGTEFMDKPVLVKGDSVDKSIKNELNNWYQKIDQEYKRILVKHGFGESIVFIGKRKND